MPIQIPGVVPSILQGTAVCSRLDIHKLSATAETCRQCEKSMRNGTVRSECSDIQFAWLPNRFIRIAGSEMLKCDRCRYMGEALSPSRRNRSFWSFSF
ncbi:hypothetical protein AVEN_90476-1 [Araneus ventricosus]|uniref:Uncharacterized protein n=1 Tax=Araneus ventricosus TaxID=182803 RepID=A0A4Y2SF44_ARAVE|nr:hypothetical protein AVEN_90476-1 [Araneus ventricosus]